MKKRKGFVLLMNYLNSYPRRPIVYLFIHLPLFKEICTLDHFEKSLIFPESDSKHRFQIIVALQI